MLDDDDDVDGDETLAYKHFFFGMRIGHVRASERAGARAIRANLHKTISHRHATRSLHFFTSSSFLFFRFCFAAFACSNTACTF